MPYCTGNVEEKCCLVLLKFMNFSESAEYPVNHKLTTKQLAPITHLDICRWMMFRAYETPKPSCNTKPTEVHSRLLLM